MLFASRPTVSSALSISLDKTCPSSLENHALPNASASSFLSSSWEKTGGTNAATLLLRRYFPAHPQDKNFPSSSWWKHTDSERFDLQQLCPLVHHAFFPLSLLWKTFPMSFSYRSAKVNDFKWSNPLFLRFLKWTKLSRNRISGKTNWFQEIRTRDSARKILKSCATTINLWQGCFEVWSWSQSKNCFATKSKPGKILNHVLTNTCYQECTFLYFDITRLDQRLESIKRFNVISFHNPAANWTIRSVLVDNPVVSKSKMRRSDLAGVSSSVHVITLALAATPLVSGSPSWVGFGCRPLCSLCSYQ